MEQGLLVSSLEAKDLFEALEINAQIGYRNCEISVCPDDKRPNLASLDDNARTRAVDKARELGMKVSAVQCHIHNGYGDASPSVRRGAVDHTKRMIDLCAKLSIPVCHTVSGVAEDDAPHEEKLDRVADSCRAILDHAKDGPVKVGLEPVFVYIVGNLAHTKGLLKRLDNRQCLCTVFRLTDYLEVFHYRQDVPQPFSEERMVIHDDHADFLHLLKSLVW